MAARIGKPLSGRIRPPPVRGGTVRRISAARGRMIRSAVAKGDRKQVAVHCDAAIGMMHADQMRLRQALLNLMSNANKFTEKGTVTIAAHQEQENGRDWTTLSVTDTGIGMTPEQPWN